MKLNELKPKAGSKKKRKRVGRGHGSGHGKTSGKGHKGQNARSGGGVPLWFEGGQMPLQRRVPKRGFTNIFKKEYTAVNIDDLSLFAQDGDITPEMLKRAGLVKKTNNIKILGNGELTAALTVHASRFSKAAKEKIEKAGGRAMVIKH